MGSTGFSAPVLLRAFNEWIAVYKGCPLLEIPFHWLPGNRQTCGDWDSECPCNPTKILVEQSKVFSFSRVVFLKAAVIPISKT